ncbi:MAG: hypothetical protein JRJ02_13005 [Deltaproteobacteria bacterium]|nr:hypothetical protein [Deltaproteobacteria bacterium]
MTSWPPESAKLIGERFSKAIPMPDFVTVIGPYTVADLRDGITAITIYKYDKAKAGEANDAIANAHTIFYGIPGYRYSLTLAAGAAASMKMAGL